MKKVSSASALVSLCLLALTGVTPILASEAEAAPMQQPQQKGIVVSGTVTDRQGEPIAGANVVLQGTQKGTMTDHTQRPACQFHRLHDTGSHS